MTTMQFRHVIAREFKAMTFALKALSRPAQACEAPLRLKYEPDYDLLSAWLGTPQVADSVEVEPGLLVRISRETGKVVGLEIVDVAARFDVDPSRVREESFVQGLLRNYASKALAAYAG
jgi:uncharacterized protein YuzE